MRVVDSRRIREILDLGEQRVWVLGREPERFGLPREAVIRIGRQVRWNLDVVEQWLARGGSAANGHDEREAA